MKKKLMTRIIDDLIEQCKQKKLICISDEIGAELAKFIAKERGDE